MSSARRQERQVKEARQSGELPPEVDNDGNMINPHVPDYMARAPWYLNQEEGAGLKHLKHQKAAVNKGDFQRHRRVHGVKAQRWAKFGINAKRSSVHGDDDGLSRPSLKRRRPASDPRQRGGASSSSSFSSSSSSSASSSSAAAAYASAAASSSSSSTSFASSSTHGPALSYDAKRDRYNGYNPEAHFQNMEKFERAQKLREKIKAERKAAQAKQAKANGAAAAAAGKAESDAESDTGLGDDDSDLDDSDDDTGNLDSDVRLSDGKAKLFGSTQGKTFHKMTQRNLRIREHTAKYLLNLDPNSAHYDPKSRSMRSNPLAGKDDALYAGDNFVRHTGDVSEMAKAQMFAWEAYNKGEDAAHLQANPTQVELAKKQFADRKKRLAEAKRRKLIEKYGDQTQVRDMSKALPHRVRFGATSAYVEYAPDGRVVKGMEKAVPKSKYANLEDQHPAGHSSVWGSYFDRDELKWGYACCWQTSKNAFCLGEDGKAAVRESKAWAATSGAAGIKGATSENHANAADKAREQRPGQDGANGNFAWNRAEDFDGADSTVYGSDKQLDPSKLRAAMAEEAKRKRRRRQAEEEDGISSSAAQGRLDASADAQWRQQQQQGWGMPVGGDADPEALEAQRLLKERAGDPLAKADWMALQEELLPMDGAGAGEVSKQ